MKLDSKVNTLAAQGGFTLIEMLIVVAIIAILVAIAVPALNTAKSDAQTSKKAAISSAIGTAKARALLKNDAITEASAANFAGIAPYLLINGVQPATAAVITDKANNGTGENITAWGNYGSGVTWGTSNALAN